MAGCMHIAFKGCKKFLPVALYSFQIESTIYWSNYYY